MDNDDSFLIQWDSEDETWTQIDAAEFIDTQLALESQAAEESGTFPRALKVVRQKKQKEPQPELWEHKRLSDNIILLSNTKFIRNCAVINNIPPASYVIVPLCEAQCFRQGSKDYGFGAKCVIIQDMENAPGTVADLGQNLSQFFGLNCPDPR